MRGSNENKAVLVECNREYITFYGCVAQLATVICINIYMNHQYIYDCLIQKRQREPATGYTERHHILPRSMGGSDDPSNLVVLTGREHWIAHLLLWKIHRNRQTAFACRMMGAMWPSKNRQNKKCSHI